MLLGVHLDQPSVSGAVVEVPTSPGDFELLRAGICEFMNSIILYTGHSTLWSP